MKINAVSTERFGGLDPRKIKDAEPTTVFASQTVGSMLTFSPVEPSWNRDPVSSDFSRVKNSSLVIDNGSFWCKAGWSTDKDPRFGWNSSPD